jgi:hypothetical protein
MNKGIITYKSFNPLNDSRVLKMSDLKIATKKPVQALAFLRLETRRAIKRAS